MEKQLPIMNVDTIKNALRIDTNEDDERIQAYLETAQDYINRAIDNESDYSSDNRFRLAVILLVQFWYTNPIADMKQTPYQVRSLIQQLRGSAWHD